MPIIIKGIHVDAGRPIVCVPVVEKMPEDILAAVDALVNSEVKMIEWRIDAYEDYQDAQSVRDILDDMRSMTKEVILLATLRTAEQGGEADLSEIELTDLYDEIAKAHVADIIDVEAFSLSDAMAVIRQLQKRGALVLLSHHDFTATPSEGAMEDLLERMAKKDGDLVKLAVMPHELRDTLRLMAVSNDFIKKHKGIPLVTVAMGKDGLLSRLAGECFGSCITFAKDSKGSAPGQVPFAELNVAMDFVHRWIG